MRTIIVNGAFGKMGVTTCEAIAQSERYQLIAGLGRNDSLKASLATHSPDIVIDFTNAHSVYDNTKVLLMHKVKSVIGASGLTNKQVAELTELALVNQTGCIIAPNFSLGAILMMQFSSVAAAYFSEAEIVETHHQQKLDAPSGTAIKTAKLIQEARSTQKNDCVSEELVPGARGAEVSDVNIHSLRLPGYIASQRVMFGGLGENLTIEHNSISRDCFMPGVLLASDKVMTLNHLVYGLEKLLSS
tara:strand:- start:79 stop:813 length:735 start_codon:yes stop_codon:yes gene_type:complete